MLFKTGTILSNRRRKLKKSQTKFSLLGKFFLAALAGQKGPGNKNVAQKGAGGTRCSVKPASRNTLLFRSHENPEPSLRSPWFRPSAWNGQANREPLRTRPEEFNHSPYHLSAPAQVTSSRY
uniref:Uncharacterized protein n=1 Tax=Fagus sylvatica TaxID=28930 RepID=A0A2N9GGX8_FAGSY